MDWLDFKLKGKKVGLIREDNRVFFILKREIYNKYEAYSISKNIIDSLSELGCITISMKSIVKGHEDEYAISIKEISFLKDGEYLIPLKYLKNSTAINDMKPQKPINNLNIF